MKHKRRKKTEQTARASTVICPQARKRSWPGKRAAKVDARRLGQIHGKELTPYLCPHCKQWHLTSQPQSKDTTP